MYAMNRHVDRDQLIEFVASRRNWVLTTVKRSGGVQMSPVTGSIGSGGRLLIATYPERAKVLNLRADPHCSICVLSDEFGGAWVQVDGEAAVIDLPEAMDGLVEYYRSAAGEHPDWNEYREAMRRQGKCLLEITITGWGPVATGGFPSSLKSMFERWQPSDHPAADADLPEPQMFDD